MRNSADFENGVYIKGMLMSMKRSVVIFAGIFLSSCGGIRPTGSEKHLRSFTQESTRPYQDAYRIIDRRMRGCYRVIGTFGNGYDVHDELDTLNRRGVIEVFRIGLAGMRPYECRARAHGDGGCRCGRFGNYHHRNRAAARLPDAQANFRMAGWLQLLFFYVGLEPQQHHRPRREAVVFVGDDGAADR